MILRMHHFRHPALWLALGWTFVAAIVYLSLTRMPISIPAAHGDKYAHIAAYAAVTFWFMQIYDTTRPRVIVVLALAALGGGLEILQYFSGYRSMEAADMAADVAGIAIGWLVGPPRTVNLLDRVEKVF
jgi:VanZ family protein